MGLILSQTQNEIYFYGTKWGSRIDLIDADDEEYYKLSFSDAEKDNFDGWINLSDKVCRIYFCRVPVKNINPATAVSGEGLTRGYSFTVLETKNWYWSIEMSCGCIIQRSKKFDNVFLYQKGVKRSLDNDKEQNENDEDKGKVHITSTGTSKDLTISDVVDWMGYPKDWKKNNKEYNELISIFEKIVTQDLKSIRISKEDKASSSSKNLVDPLKHQAYHGNDDKGSKTITYRKGRIKIANYSMMKSFFRGLMTFLYFIFCVYIGSDVILDLYLGSVVHIV